MRIVSSLLFATFIAASSSGVALAQDPPDPAQGDPAATPDPAAGTTDPAAAPPGRWPRSVIQRPLTLPKGLLAAGLDISTLTSSFFDPANIRLSAGYGITDDIELAFASYSFPTSSAGDGSLDVGFGYKLARGAMGGKLDVAGRAQIGYSLGGEAVKPLLLGAHLRYNITPKIALVSGTPGTGHIEIGLDPDVTFAIKLPIGVGLQATPELYVQLDTLLATIGIEPSGSAFIFADTTPISITATYNAMPALDVLVGLSLNLTPPDIPAVPPAPAIEGNVGDTIALLVGARYYVGAL